MCLCVNKDKTIAVRNGSWPLKVYKVLRWDFDTQFRSGVNGFLWAVGLNASSRHSTELVEPIEANEVHVGFHAFLHRHDAEEMRDLRGEMVVELEASLEHFVAAGSDNGIGASVVFTKLSLSPEEYQRVLAAARAEKWDFMCDEDDEWEDDGWEDDDEDDDDWEDDEEEDWEDDDWYEDDDDDDDEDWEDDEEDDDWDDEDEDEDEDKVL